MRRVSVSLTMIVKNEEDNLPHCLASVAGLFDEIVVVDTGSTDRTKEIALGFGAKVFDFAWIDDFAAARNASLARATGDYAFWLDADDVLEPAERNQVASALFSRLDPHQPDRLTWCAARATAPPMASGGETVWTIFVSSRSRRYPVDVSRARADPAGLRRAKVPVQWTDITVRHTGYSDRALRIRKLERDAKILRSELEVPAERTVHPVQPRLDRHRAAGMAAKHSIS